MRWSPGFSFSLVNYHLLIWWITLFDLLMLSQSCISGIRPTEPLCINLFIYCWVWFAIICVNFFASMFMRDINLPLNVFVFFWYQSNGIRVILVSKNDLGTFFFSAIFFFNLINLFIYIFLFLAVLGLRFCARAFSSCGKRGSLFIAVRGPLTVAASLVAEHKLQTCRLSSCGSRA